MQTFGKYISIAGLLILVFLLVRNASGAARIINGLSAANTNAIIALQGNATGFQSAGF